MKVYLVWRVGTQPRDGVRFTAANSFEARKAMASAWDCDVTEVMARAESE